MGSRASLWSRLASIERIVRTRIVMCYQFGNSGAIGGRHVARLKAGVWIVGALYYVYMLRARTRVGAVLYGVVSTASACLGVIHVADVVMAGLSVGRPDLLSGMANVRVRAGVPFLPKAMKRPRAND